MESLAEETWDVVIAGTGIVQALLALALSRTDLKILHVDQNTYYGGVDAGLSLDEAGVWAEKYKDEYSPTISSACVTHSAHSTSALKSSRAYTLSLNPQIVYAQSKFLPALVSSTINAQLEFMAVGSWWIYDTQENSGSSGTSGLRKIPSSREDVFADDNLSRRDKIGLMKFMRYIVQEDQDEGDAVIYNDLKTATTESESLQSVLSSKFKISEQLLLPISALALITQAVDKTKFEAAVPRIRRHMKSIGYFGPGFGAVMAKYASNAEIAQVCCRACAVGGATYLLGQGISGVVSSSAEEAVEVELTDGTRIKSRFVVGDDGNLPAELTHDLSPKLVSSSRVCRSISIVSLPLRHFFPPTSENGPIPAAAIVLVTDNRENDNSVNAPPIYLQIHSEDTGECPPGQSIIYASVLVTEDKDTTTTTQERLTSAVHTFLTDQAGGGEGATGPISTSLAETAEALSPPEILWSMSYVCHLASSLDDSPDTKGLFAHDSSGRMIAFHSRKQDIAFDDDVLTRVEAVWRKIMGEKAEGVEFLRFEERRGNGEDDEDDDDE